MEFSRKAISLEPDNAAAHYNLGTALARTDGPPRRSRNSRKP